MKKKKRKRKQKKGRTPKNSLALCMIVKNEAANLRRCLESVRGLVSEINIVDTGSDDDTVRTAKRLGARVRTEQWTGDFSRARNRSLEMARTEWILVLDGDEILSADAASRLKAAISNPDIVAYVLPTRNYTNDPTVANFVPNDGSYEPALPFEGWVESRKVRLFRNLPGVRFEGEIHELVEPSVRRCGGRMEFLDAVVHHFGYIASEEALRGKTEKMASIAEKNAPARVRITRRTTSSALSRTTSETWKKPRAA